MVERIGLGRSRPRAVVVVGIALACVALLLTGYGVAVLFVAGAAGAVALARRTEPQQRIRVERFVEVAELPHSCDVVWALIKPAESAPILEPSIRRGYHVPGTPLGLGERQAFELIDGTTTIAEVVEYEHGRRAVTVQVSPVPDVPVRYVHSLEPVEGRCRLSFEIELDVPEGQLLNPAAVDEWRSSIRAEFDRIRHALGTRTSDTTADEP